MPLNIEIHRNGEVREDIKWSDEVLFCILTAAYKEFKPDTEFADGKTFGELENGQFVSFMAVPIYYLDLPLIKKGKQVMKHTHKFPELELEAGDVIRAWRSMKSD